MHDAEAKKVTVEALPSIIDYLTGQGYTFENFYKIIKWAYIRKLLNIQFNNKIRREENCFAKEDRRENSR